MTRNCLEFGVALYAYRLLPTAHSLLHTSFFLLHYFLLQYFSRLTYHDLPPNTVAGRKGRGYHVFPLLPPAVCRLLTAYSLLSTPLLPTPISLSPSFPVPPHRPIRSRFHTRSCNTCYGNTCSSRRTRAAGRSYSGQGRGFLLRLLV